MKEERREKGRRGEGAKGRFLGHESPWHVMACAFIFMLAQIVVHICTWVLPNSVQSTYACHIQRIIATFQKNLGR